MEEYKENEKRGEAQGRKREREKINRDLKERGKIKAKQRGGKGQQREK